VKHLQQQEVKMLSQSRSEGTPLGQQLYQRAKMLGVTLDINEVHTKADLVAGLERGYVENFCKPDEVFTRNLKYLVSELFRS